MTSQFVLLLGTSTFTWALIFRENWVFKKHITHFKKQYFKKDKRSEETLLMRNKYTRISSVLSNILVAYTELCM